MGRAIELRPESGGDYYNRGSYYEHLHDYGAALSDFRRARELGLVQDDDMLVDAADHHIPSLERLLAGGSAPQESDALRFPQSP